MPIEKFLGLANILLEENDAWISDTFDNKLILQSGYDFLEAIEVLQGVSYPLKPGPIIRRENNVICLDLFAASQFLNHSLEYPNLQGEVANIRAFHFEKIVQETVDLSLWRPKAEIKELKGRILRLNNHNITDIDCIGENNSRLLIIDCMSLVYNSKYDIGDFKTVRNVQSAILKKLK